MEFVKCRVSQRSILAPLRGGSRAAATSKMERFLIIVNGWKPLTIITKRSILDVEAALDPPLPVLFLLYVNDLKNAISHLDPIMLADNVNFFYTRKNIHCLFSDVNKELSNINEWFIAKNLSLNVGKTKYSFFHKPSKKDNIPVQLLNLTISNRKIKREESIKFLGVLLKENVT